MSRIGLIDRSEPTSAWAPPMRPPFLRLSSVSSAPITWVRRTRSSTRATTSSARRARRRPPRAASTHLGPRPEVIERESTTCTGRSPAIAVAAVRADCIVADRPEERLMHTTASAPAAAWRRNAASNLPGAGAAVSGSSARGAELLVERLDRELRAVLELLAAEADRQRDHLDAVGRRTTSSERSQLLSVTMRTGMRWGAPWSAPAGGRTVQVRRRTRCRRGCSRPRADELRRCASAPPVARPPHDEEHARADRQHEADAGHGGRADRVAGGGEHELAVGRGHLDVERDSAPEVRARTVDVEPRRLVGEGDRRASRRRGARASGCGSAARRRRGGRCRCGSSAGRCPSRAVSVMVTDSGVEIAAATSSTARPGPRHLLLRGRAR